jgi:hypothetical protein
MDNSFVEAVEKAPKQILGRDAEKSDRVGCAPINDLMLGRGQETPENIVRLARRTFPTGSLYAKGEMNDSV